jgi:hypothetical protein
MASASGQFSPEKTALNRMEKGKWKDAEKALRKAHRKDSINTEVTYIFSWYFSASGNPAANIDSAYHYSLMALRDFSRSSVKEKERLKRFPLDSAVLIRHHQKIDSTAFERAKKINTEKGYNDFLSTFTTADQRGAATELKDEVAFLEALKINTIEGFQDYLHKHPVSIRANEAEERYEKLLYQDKTQDGKLKSYESFYSGFPSSTWRLAAEKNIFEISTASGRISSYIEFIEKYPASKFRQRALALLYHLMKDDEHDSNFLSDSLKEVQRQEKGYWVPVLRNGKFGFMDQNGVETIKPVLDSIRSDYLCGNIHADYLTVAGGIINRAGNWIIKGSLRDVQDIGIGFLKITRGECNYAVHKSGWSVSENCFEDIKLVARHFIAFRDHGKWGILSLSGRLLIEPQFEDVLALDTLIIFAGNGKKSLVTIDQIASIADRNFFTPTLVFDDVRRLSFGNYLVRNGTLEGVLNENLKFIIPLDRHRISISPAGFILESEQKYKVTGLPPIDENKEFDQVRFYGKWVGLRVGKEIQLYNLERKRPEAILPDSLWFQNQLAFTRVRDSIHVYINSGVVVSWSVDDKINFMKSIDSSRYFFITDKKKKTIFNAASGKRMFSIISDAVEYIGHNAFLISKGNKKGILYRDGKVLLPVEYAAVVPVAGDWVSLLKEKQFGLYNLSSRKLMKPVYDRNVLPFSKRLLIAYKNGGYGFVDMDSKPQGKFEFEEIRTWNDTAALVKKNFLWMIIGVRSHKIIIGDIREYHFVVESPQENIAVVRRNNYVGVISNRRGVLIPANFTDIINVGSPDEPLFFTEKNVEEAGIHVVIYYNRNGKVLRKQALEDEEYERLSCEEN